METSESVPKTPLQEGFGAGSVPLEAAVENRPGFTGPLKHLEIDSSGAGSVSRVQADTRAGYLLEEVQWRSVRMVRGLEPCLMRRG